MAKKSQNGLQHCRIAKTTHPKAPWRVSYPTEEGGKKRTKRRTFAHRADAYAFAREKDKEVANHGIRFGDITAEARRAFDHYRDQRAELAAEGVSVPPFEVLVADGLRRLRAEHKAALQASLPLPEAVQQYLEYKKTRVGARRFRDLQNRLKRFCRDFGPAPIDSFTPDSISEWLASLRGRYDIGSGAGQLVGPSTRNAYRAVLHSFFAFAAAPGRRWIATNPIADLEREKVADAEPQAYRPEQVAAVMTAALEMHPELVAPLALGFFAGLRTCEAEGIDLGTIDLTADEFRTPAQRKTGARLAPMTDACRAWLTVQPRRRGPGWTRELGALAALRRKVFAAAGVEPIPNGARKSFISYRVAEIRDVARASDEVGNSPVQIKKHYRRLVTSEAAARYFAILP